MAKRRRLQLSREEDLFLRTLYRHHRVPTDQFRKRPGFHSDFTATWNEGTGRTDSPEEVLHYMVTLRKKGRWERFDGRHLPSPSVNDLLSVEEWALIDTVYREGGVASDNFAFDLDTLDRIEGALLREFGHTVSRSLLCAAIIERRKSGLLPRTDRPMSDDPDKGIGFSDIDDI
ncbi:MAG: hypothetical protein H6810_00725 [Phycisphaeraceae bacterium]|nr:MAG: hypothetical protein H6810_00725 [Phycisphaeraceae bacterium]